MAGEDRQTARRARPGPWPPALSGEASGPRPPLSWARRSGFKPRFSGESTPTTSGHIVLSDDARVDPMQTSSLRSQTSSAPAGPIAEKRENGVRETADQAGRKDSNWSERVEAPSVAPGRASNPTLPHLPSAMARARRDEALVTIPRVAEDEDEVDDAAHAHMNYELRDTPGFVPIIFYAVQHYISIHGSLILVPLVIVPAMGGTSEDAADVVCTVLFVSGITTLLNSFFGSRLPLIQGPSFVFLAPTFALINSPDFVGLTENQFKHIMKELQGALIISSAFQAILGLTGIMSLLLRLINPVVVSPTIAAVGLSFLAYGFTQVSYCLEIGLLQILVVVIFSLYLRNLRVFNHRLFLIYAVPLGLSVTWAVAFLLTEAGVYGYKGCDISVPGSNIISDYCKKHVSRMKYCRVDTSHALKSSSWFRFPYPLQWGLPVFNWKLAIVMCVVSIISSVDSIGVYHASSLLVASMPPTPGVLSRGIFMEGISSVLAGLWGTGFGCTTLTENIHTIAITKMGSRRVIGTGAIILIMLSLVGKVGGFLASIPVVMVAGLLCFMWAMLTAIGLSNLRYGETGSSRNHLIVGLSMFFSLSIPAYFQQYGIAADAYSPVPSYFQPYIIASHGPFHTRSSGLNYVLNTLLSLHMVVAFLIAVILDNTVPGSRRERGIYVWSDPKTAQSNSAALKEYELPFRCRKAFGCFNLLDRIRRS